MVQAICIYENINYQNLLPLVYFRPVYELRCGILTLKEKIELSYRNIPVILHSREYLTETLRLKYPNYSVNNLPQNISSCLFINGSVVANSNIINQILLDGEDIIYYNKNGIIAAKLSGKYLEDIRKNFSSTLDFEIIKDVPKKNIEVVNINYPWDLVNLNGSEIISDFERLVDKSQPLIKGKIYEGVHLIEPNNIFIDEGTKIKPGVVLDAESGPIYIGKNVKIFPNAAIEGPCFIGDGSAIKIGAKIYENTSIGEVCKVGGEVECSVIHSYSNKQHDGFLGHAYLTQWINLGADTNNSDLKNNYSSVKVTINNKVIDSGSMFMGLIMGDHSKSAVNTMFNTGTVVGVCCNVFGSGFPPKFIPSFSWGGSDKMTVYELEKSIEVAKRVMARRNVEFTDAYKKLYEKIFEITETERNYNCN